MEISFTTAPTNLRLNNGYGLAGYGVVTSLLRLGHKVPFKSSSAPIEIAFCQPDYSEWSKPSAYHIQYTPWESTGIPKDWVTAFNHDADEVWTPSPLVAQWYEDAGVTTPIKVYEHGVDSMWKPQRRRVTNKLKFLHVGEPSQRKGGEETVEAFRRVFGDREDVHLTIKAWNTSTIRVYDSKRESILGLPHQLYNNVTTIFNDVTPEEMVYIFEMHHVLVYPSWGEGFGLIPLQGLASGMPTICTEAWAPYKRFLIPELRVGSTLVDSPWPNMHPGQMFKPHQSDIENSMRYVSENFDRVSGLAYRNAFKVKEEYSWDRLTKNAFDPVIKKVQ